MHVLQHLDQAHWRNVMSRGRKCCQYWLNFWGHPFSAHNHSNERTVIRERFLSNRWQWMSRQNKMHYNCANLDASRSLNSLSFSLHFKCVCICDCCCCRMEATFVELFGATCCRFNCVSHRHKIIWNRLTCWSLTIMLSASIFKRCSLTTHCLVSYIHVRLLGSAINLA